jgi:hypothetical protein
MKKLGMYFGIIMLASVVIVSCKKKEEEVVALDENTKQFNDDAN